MMEENCMNCRFMPNFEKLYDDLSEGFCREIGKVVTYGAATHGETEEWFSINDCARWRGHD
jgi:hypothetical protein